jgi:transporter family-2 protein
MSGSSGSSAIAFLSSLIVGQLLCAVVLDHFGFLNLPIHAISPLRLVGVLILIGGMFLIQRFLLGLANF